jgi:hypothetical protein
VVDVAADEVDTSVDIWLGPCFLFLDQKLENGFMVTGKNPTISGDGGKDGKRTLGASRRSFGQETRHGLQMCTSIISSNPTSLALVQNLGLIVNHAYVHLAQSTRLTSSTALIVSILELEHRNFHAHFR